MNGGDYMILNRILEKRNMTQYRLWKESGVPQATISDICTGKTKIEKCSAETIDYVSRVNEIPLCKNYNDIRKFKLEEPLFPADVLVLCKALGNDRPKEECMCNAIPEFV